MSEPELTARTARHGKRAWTKDDTVGSSLLYKFYYGRQEFRVNLCNTVTSSGGIVPVQSSDRVAKLLHHTG